MSSVDAEKDEDIKNLNSNSTTKLTLQKQETDLEVDQKPPNFHTEFLQDCARERNLFLLCESLLKFARTVSKLSISVLPFWVRYDQNQAIFCMYYIFQTTHKITLKHVDDFTYAHRMDTWKLGIRFKEHQQNLWCFTNISTA